MFNIFFSVKFYNGILIYLTIYSTLTQAIRFQGVNPRFSDSVYIIFHVV